MDPAVSGLTPAALRKYHDARKTKPASRLLAKRLGRKRKSGRPREAFKTRPFLVNRGRSRRNRGMGRYARFVKAFSARTGLSGKSLFRAAGRAWSGGSRRNAVLPVSYNRKRRRGRRARRNAVLPVSYNRKRRKGRRSRRNSAILPVSYNRGGRYRTNDPVAVIRASAQKALSVDFWTDTVLPMGAGFIGGQFLGGVAYSFIQKLTGAQTGFMGSLQKIGSRAIGAIAAAGVSVLVPFKRKGRGGDIAAKVLAGGLVAVFAAILQEVFGQDTYSKMTGMADFDNMAEGLTEELKARIADSVRGEITRQEGGVNGVSAFVTTQDLSRSPYLGPGPQMGGFATAEEIAEAPRLAGINDAPCVADLGTFSDSMADAMLV